MFAFSESWPEENSESGRVSQVAKVNSLLTQQFFDHCFDNPINSAGEYFPLWRGWRCCHCQGELWELLALNSSVVVKTLGSEREEQKERGSVQGGGPTVGLSKVKWDIHERISASGDIIYYPVS